MQVQVFDQYSAKLKHSPELRDVTRYIADALRGKQPEERVAIGQDLAVSLRRKRVSYVDALDQVDQRRRERSYHDERRVAIAGSGADCCSPGPNVDPMCTADGRRICDYDRIGYRTLAVNGGTAGSLLPVPAAGFAEWRPRLVRFWAMLSTDPAVPGWEGLFISQIKVGSHPVEGFDANPAAANQNGVHFGDFVTPTPPGIPVGWPKISNNANALPVEVNFWSLWGAGTNIIAFATIMGNPVQDGRICRVNGNSNPVPAMPLGFSAGKMPT